VDAATPLFIVADMARLWLVVHAFERDALRIRAGASARVSFPALPGQEFEGKVTRVGSRVDPSSRTLDVRVELDNPDGLLRPGMSGSASIPVGDANTQVITVPVAAIQRLEEDWLVFIPESEPGHFELRPVGRGRELAGEVEILRGLAAGESVVVDGAFLLKAEADKARGGGAEHHH
jgi:cobalt-zinc-cadmium efflux system membrane fusion protein